MLKKALDSQTATCQRVFLSYARADDAEHPFAADLYRALSGARFGVWWDRISMPSRGLTFLQEIRDAIDGCDRVVLLVGEAAVHSDYVRQEWQYALVAGKIVNPVLVAGGFDLLPPELRNLDCPDLTSRRNRRSAMQHLLRVLGMPVSRLGELFGPIPQVPGHFQPPGDQISALADKTLRDTRRPIVLKPLERTTVIHGMPGAGKSVLAAAFGRATEVRRAFPDGVIWIAGGRDLSSQRVVDTVCAAMQDGVVHKSASRESKARLQKALKDKSCLIVLDDVWALEPVEPVANALGTRSRMLITTRLAELQSSLGSPGFLVDGLTEVAARHLLADWCGIPVDQLAPEANDVALECGCLPFALALCGAMVADGGVDWADLLVKLKSADVGFLEKRFINYPYTSILRAMAASIAQLARGRKHAAQRYLELVVFPPNAAIPVSAIEALWSQSGSIDALQSRKLLAILQGVSLLRFSDSGRGSVVLHDLQWDYLAAAIPHRRRLHRLILAAYDRLQPLGFVTAPEGDYILDQASWHLEEAGDCDRLYRLVDQEWFDRKCSREMLRRSFVTDLDRVIRVSRGGCPGALHELARGSLIRAHIASLEGDFPSEALYVLARCGAVGHALDLLALVESPLRRCELCLEIAAGLQEKGEARDAKALALTALDTAWPVEHLRLNVLARVALLLAELNDPDARRLVGEATTAYRTGQGLPAVFAATKIAIAASLLGRRCDAEKMMGRAEPFVSRESAPFAFEAWIKLGEPVRTVRLANRMGSSDLELQGLAALALAKAGEASHARRLWMATRRALSRRKHEDVGWYSAIPARLGKPGEAEVFIKRGMAHASPDRRVETQAGLLARVAAELADAGLVRPARTRARHALALARSVGGPSTAVTILDSERFRRKPDLLASVAGAFLACGDEALAITVACEALRGAMRFKWHTRTVGTAKAAIAEAFAGISKVACAKDIADRIEDDYAREKCFARLARSLAAREQYGDCLDVAARISDEWRQSAALAEAIRAVPIRALGRAGRKLGDAITHETVRQEFLCWLASHLPSLYLSAARKSFPKLANAESKANAALHLVRALHQIGERTEVATILRDLWNALPLPDRPERMTVVGCLAQLLVLTGERSQCRSLMSDVDSADDEYSACGLSRVAFAFAEAGWLDEAGATARHAAKRAKRIGEGRPHGTADVFARLVSVMTTLNDPALAASYAERALKALQGESGSNSAYEYPHVVRQAVGRRLGGILGPQRALDLIVGAASSSEFASEDTLFGLYEHVITASDIAGAHSLATAIVSRCGEPSPWMTVRMAALHNEQRDFARARALLANAFQQVSRSAPDAALDVIEHGAGIMAGMYDGRTLENVYRSLVDIQGWGASDLYEINR